MARDKMTSILFLIAILKLSLINGSAFLIVPIYFISIMNNTTANKIQNTHMMVIHVLCTFKKLRYFTLAALIPSFSFEGQYSAISMITENVIKTPIEASTMIQKKNPAQNHIKIIRTKLDPSAMRDEYIKSLNASYKSQTKSYFNKNVTLLNKREPFGFYGEQKLFYTSTESWGQNPAPEHFGTSLLVKQSTVTDYIYLFH